MSPRAPRPRRTGCRPRRAVPTPRCSAASSQAGDVARSSAIGEFAPEHRADLRDLSRVAEPVEPRGERLLQRRRDRCAPPSPALQQEPRHLLDEQRHAAGALGDASTLLFENAWRPRSRRPCCRPPRGRAGQTRSTPWCERVRPWRAEFRPRGRDNEQRRLRAALGEGLHEVERGRIGPVQILEGEHDRLRPRAGQQPGDHRRQLPSPQFLRREFGALTGGRGISRAARAAARARQGRASPARASLSRSARRFSAGSRRRRTAAGPIRRSDAAASSATAARTPIRPRCAASRRASRETLRSAATCRCRARRRFATNWPSPERARSQRRASRSSSSSRPTSGVSARAPSRRPPPLARTIR